MKKQLAIIGILVLFISVGLSGCSSVENKSPTVSFSANPRTGTAPLTVLFTASGTDPDGTIASYNWNFGDGSTSHEQNPIHTFTLEGTFEVELTVIDDDGDFDRESIFIIVSPGVTYDDDEFMSWWTNASSDLSGYIDALARDINYDLWYALEQHAENAENAINDSYKPVCVAFSLSSTYEPIRAEINSSLDDVLWYFVYSQYAAKNMQDYIYNGKSTYSSAMSNFDEANEYLNRANAHMIIANEMIKDLD
jgi:PKD repeat protein